MLRQCSLQSIAAVSVPTWLRTPFSDFSHNFLSSLNRGTINQLGPLSRAFWNHCKSLQSGVSYTRDLAMRHGSSSWKRPVLSVHSPSNESLALVCGYHWPQTDMRAHLFTRTLCRAWIVSLDCTFIIACVQSRWFVLSPFLRRELWTSWVHAGRQNWCFPEPLCNAWREPVHLLFGSALTPERGAIMETTVAQRRPKASAQLKSLTILTVSVGKYLAPCEACPTLQALCSVSKQFCSCKLATSSVWFAAQVRR